MHSIKKDGKVKAHIGILKKKGRLSSIPFPWKNKQKQKQNKQSILKYSNLIVLKVNKVNDYEITLIHSILDLPPPLS